MFVRSRETRKTTHKTKDPLNKQSSFGTPLKVLRKKKRNSNFERIIPSKKWHASIRIKLAERGGRRKKRAKVSKKTAVRGVNLADFQWKKKENKKNNEVGYYCCLVSVLVAQCEIRTHRARALPLSRHFPFTTTVHRDTSPIRKKKKQ